MPTVIERVLDVLFPLPKEEQRVRTLTLGDIHTEPRTHYCEQLPITSLMRFEDEHVRSLMWSLKYRRLSHATALLASILNDALLEHIAEIRMMHDAPIFLVPVPLHLKRERQRGYNQVTRVLEHPHLHHLYDSAPPLFNCLVRTRYTQSQTRLKRADRLTNVRGAFALNPSHHIHNLRGAHVLLVDDVTTTGATLFEAARPLTQAGAQVHAYALARAAERF